MLGLLIFILPNAAGCQQSLARKAQPEQEVLHLSLA